MHTLRALFANPCRARMTLANDEQAAKGGIDKQTVITVIVVIVVLAVMLVCSFVPVLRLPMVGQCTALCAAQYKSFSFTAKARVSRPGQLLYLS